MRIATLLAGIAIAAISTSAIAEPMAVEPGEWEFVRVAPGPMSGKSTR
jgi:hypothetical protein